jgi:hypothetical protein
MQNPSELKYTASHEWLRDNGDGTATVGITFHAQDALGELVYVELPEAGRQVSAGEACVVVESTKARPMSMRRSTARSSKSILPWPTRPRPSMKRPSPTAGCSAFG